MKQRLRPGTHQQLHKHPPQGHGHNRQCACTRPGTSQPHPDTHHTRRSDTSGSHRRPGRRAHGLMSAGPARSGPGTPPRPSNGSRPVIARRPVTPRVPDGESPTPRHTPGAAALTRPARAWPRTSPGRTPGRALPRSPSPGPALGAHPAHLPGRPAGAGKPAGSAPSRPPPDPGPVGRPGPVGMRQPRSPADCGAGTGGSGRPRPLPRLCGQPGAGREVVGGAWVPAGAPAFRPALTGQEAGPGRPAQAFLPPPPDRPRTGST